MTQKALTPGRPTHQLPADKGQPHRFGRWIAPAVLVMLVLAVILTAGLQGTPIADAQMVVNNDATGQPGIVDQANPNDTLTTLRPGMTLIAVTTDIMDDDGITTPNWIYQWAYFDGTNVSDITGATAITYLLEDKDIGKALILKVTFTDDLSNPEGPLESTSTRFVGPKNLIVSNTGGDPFFRTSIALTATTPKFAQGFEAASGPTTDNFTLDFAELTFGNIEDTATIDDGITVTLNEDSSGSPGGELCTLEDPATFSTSGPHNFYAPTAGISTLCPLLEAGTAYHIVVARVSGYTGNVTITHDLETRTDKESAIGWETPDEAQHYSNSAWANYLFEYPMLIDVRARLTEFELAELTETEVPFGWSLTPEGIASGQKFRLMFLTEDESPTSTDIDVYNEFVQAQAAAGHADIQEHASQFRVLGSTAAVDARDNTETTSSDTDAPIYWLNGEKVADNYADLYDETWDEEINRRTAAGDLSTDTDIIWTGSNDNGTERTETAVSVALGETSVRQGEMDNSASTRDPLSASTVTAATNTAPFYALSGIFRVEPNTEATTTHTLAVKRNPRVADELYTNHTRSRIIDPEGVPSSGFHIQWFRYDPATDTETEIEGATGEPYFVTHTDAERQLSFTVSFTDNEGNPEILVSERSEPVLPYDVLLRNKPGHDEVDAPLNATVLRYAQKFNTGHQGIGYHVESIGFHLSQVDDPTTAGNHLQVRLQLPDDDGNPDRTICILRDPATFSAPGIHHFTNPPSVGRCPNLERNTDYFAVIYRTVTSTTDIINVTVTTETDEAQASSIGWTIEDASLRYTNNAWEDSPSSHRAVIEVKGDQAREITIPIDSPLIPDGLSGGSFRLIFVASTSTATGGDINRYQVNLTDALADANDGEPETLAVRQLDQDSTSNIRLVTSTDEVDARDNTFSTYTSSHKGVPIFWYKGAIVANDYEDFYDGSWQNENQPRDWHGDPVTDLNQEYWTGSNDDGTAKTRGGVSKALGQSEVEAGKLNETGSSPLSHAAGDPTQQKYLFAITGIFKIENHEPVGVPSITGVPRVGETLTADTSAITDANGTDEATFTYEWLKIDGTFTTPIAGANNETYTPTAALAGKQITLDVIMWDNHGYRTAFQNFQIDPTEPIQSADLIVKNTEVGTPTALNASPNSRQAQGFTAASDAEPYSLTEVRISFAAVDDPAAASTEITLTINAETSGFPGEELCTLSNPSSITGSGLSTFEAPDSCPPLTTGNTYYVVFARGSNASGDIEVNLTGTPGQHEGSAPGWTRDFPLDIFNNGTWVQSVFTNNIVLDIRGEIPTEVRVPENWSLTPSGLVGGDKFRLMFITSAGHSPTSDDIESYNAYVQSQAKASNSHTDIKDYAYHFRILGSTEDVDARDNTRTNPNDYTSAPIHWMNGAKIADDSGDLYDGSWDDEANPRGHDGNTVNVDRVWTGSDTEGTEAFHTSNVSLALGNDSARVGRLANSTQGFGPLSTTEHFTNTTNWPYYALSNIFIAPNSDATGQPTITGTPRVSQTLSVDTAGITDPEGTDDARFTYQWVRVDDGDETDIDGATRSTYRPTDEDADKKIKVKVSFKDDQGFDEGPLTSEPSARIISRDVLVSNNTPDSDLNLGFTAAAPITAQGFTTGADADGYTLGSVSVQFDTSADLSTAGAALTATIRAESGAAPGTTLCTLVDPPSFAQGRNTFTAPSTGTICPVLSTNTTYFFAIEHHDPDNTEISLKATNSNSEDAGSRLGWLILNDNHYYDSTWKTDSGSIKIQVKGTSAVESIVSDHRAWVDNRQGDADTSYENTGNLKIAQGFRTGDTAGIFEVHEIHVDFDRGQPAPETIQVRIVESTAPDDDWEYATPSGFWKGGNYSPQDVTTDGVHTFRRTSGNSALKANTNYFLVIESTNDDSSDAAIVRMTTHEGDDSSDGWTVDNYSHTKSKQDNATWTKQDHQVRFRISGSYRDGIGTPGDSYAFESCVELRRGEVTNCIAAIAVPEPADPENPPENVSRSRLVLDQNLFPEIHKWWTGWWQWMHEYITFPVTMHPLPTGNDYVTMSFGTRDHTAIDGQDYWGGSGSVRFDANSGHTQIVNIRIIDDRAEDSGDYFNFYIYQCKDQDGDSCDHLFVDSSVKGIIYNTEESAEIAKLKVSDVTVTEGEGATAEFTVSLNASVTAAVYFDYTTEDGSAKDGTDYTGGNGAAFIGNGDTSVTISVDIANDDVWTGDRSFTLKISDAVYATIADDSGTATIKDDEPQPLIARFTDIPSGNHGESNFTFNISFNQDVSTKYLVMQNDALTVTNGEISRAERINGSRDFWRITVEPDSGADVTVHLPTTESCSDTGAICTQGNDPQKLSNSVTQTFVGTALNVRFASNANHNGKDAFTAELIFSEETGTTAAELKDHALTTQGGSITSVAAKTEGSTRAWTVTLQPSGLGHLTITLAGATDCATDGHVCTAGGKLLSHTLIKKIYGPVQLSVSDAATTEGEGATLTFTVTAENDTVNKYTVSYATSDGTATAGEDYTATSGVLAYTYGAGPLTVSVLVLNDEDDEDDETVILTLSNPSDYVHIADGEATGTILDSAQEQPATNSAATGLPAITGAPKAGEPLTADTSAINDANGLTNVEYSYQWIRTTDGQDADIDNATGSSYTPDNNDAGKTLKVSVTFKDDADNDESLTSLPTVAVAKTGDGTIWSADMEVVKYGDTSIGAASADLFSNVGGSSELQIRSLWSHIRTTTSDWPSPRALPTPTTTP